MDCEHVVDNKEEKPSQIEHNQAFFNHESGSRGRGRNFSTHGRGDNQGRVESYSSPKAQSLLQPH